LRTSHIKTRFQCNLCHRLYTDPVRPNLSSQLILYFNTKKKNIFFQAVLKQHKVTKHNMEAPYKCQDCNLSFIYKSMLNNHQKLHLKGYAFKPKKTAEERKNMVFQCQTCLKLFRNEPNLKRHVDTVHLRVRKYICGTCQKPFSQKSALETHIRIHTGLLLLF
jgi:KRAB domain-containing zinc finger protein